MTTSTPDKTHVRKTCKACGGTNVRKDADVMWDEKAQYWAIAGIYDNETCDNCGGETEIVDKAIPAPTSLSPLPHHVCLLMLQAAKIAGSLVPGEFLPCIEEQLTLDECRTVEGFLEWLNREKLSFGHGNLQARFADYQLAQNGA